MKRVLCLLLLITVTFTLFAKNKQVNLILKKSIPLQNIRSTPLFTVSDSFLFFREYDGSKENKTYCLDHHGNIINKFKIEPDSIYQYANNYDYWPNEHLLSIYSTPNGRIDYFNEDGTLVHSKNNLSYSEILWDFAELNNYKYYLTMVLPSTKVEFIWNIYKEDANKNLELIKANKLSDFKLEDISNIEAGLFMDSNNNKTLVIVESALEDYKISIYQHEDVKELAMPKMKNMKITEIRAGENYILMNVCDKKGKHYEYRIFDFNGNYIGYIKTKNIYALEFLGDDLYVFEKGKKNKLFVNVYNIQ